MRVSIPWTVTAQPAEFDQRTRSEQVVTGLVASACASHTLGPMREIVGRVAELAAGGAFVRAIDDGPALLLLEGEAGIGKTTVWAAIAHDRGGRRPPALTLEGGEGDHRWAVASRNQ